MFLEYLSEVTRRSYIFSAFTQLILCAGHEPVVYQAYAYQLHLTYIARFVTFPKLLMVTSNFRLIR